MSPKRVILRLLGPVLTALLLSGLNSDGRGRQVESAGEPELCQGNYLSEPAARHQLAEFARGYSTAAQWEARARRVREGILKGAGLLPPPRKCPLNPIAHSRRDHDGYSVENVAFESLPGFFVTGNLYRPKSGKPPYRGRPVSPRTLHLPRRRGPVPSGHAAPLGDPGPDGGHRLLIRYGGLGGLDADDS